MSHLHLDGDAASPRAGMASLPSSHTFEPAVLQSSTLWALNRKAWGLPVEVREELMHFYKAGPAPSTLAPLPSVPCFEIP